jgi:hypothetical protein
VVRSTWPPIVPGLRRRLFRCSGRLVRGVSVETVSQQRLKLQGWRFQSPVTNHCNQRTYDEFPRTSARNTGRAMLLIDLARCRQSDRRGDLTSLAHALPHRGLSTGCPGRAGLELIREPRLVDEDDHGAPAASLFLTRGQSRSSQARINSSSRSRARITGTWVDHPNSLSRGER